MTLNDFLDPGIQFLSVSSTASSAAAKVICSGPAIGSSGSITCSSPSFPAGGVANITILAQCAPNITGVRQNIADAIPLGPPFPERASVLQRIQNNAGLQLFMTATPVVLAGDTVVYNIQVLDDGASSALGVLVEDQLPGSTSFVSATGTGNFQNACSFKPATNKVQCFASELTTGVAEITIVAKSSDVKKPDGLSNTATLRASTPLVTNSQVSVSTTVLTK